MDFFFWMIGRVHWLVEYIGWLARWLVDWPVDMLGRAFSVRIKPRKHVLLAIIEQAPTGQHELDNIVGIDY